MKIKKAIIHNWRSIEDIEIEFENLMVFIGQNNHGKSNILTAILFFFGEFSCDIPDFYKDSDELFVQIVFDDLTDEEKITFKKYVTPDETLIVRKNATKENCKGEYHGFKLTPEHEWLREDKAAKYAKRDAITVIPLTNYVQPAGKLSKLQVQEAQQKYIEEHKDTLKFSSKLEEGNFLGLKNVAKGIWGDIFFIPAIKKASDELATKGSSVFNLLYSKVLEEMSENSQEFQNAKQQLESLMRRLNKHDSNGKANEDRPAELTEFEELLGNELTGWDTSIDIQVIPPDMDSILRIGTTIWIDDGMRTDITRKGQGLQRALIFGLVRSMAKLQKQKNTEPTEKKSREASKSVYYILEEPELFLHPQAQRKVFDSLLELAKESQVILCTHSSSFLSMEWYKSICRVCKVNNDSGTTVYQCTDDLFGDVGSKKHFNMVGWINPDRSELFFAKKVVLLEGDTEKVVIPYLAKKLDIFRHDYTLVNCGSKDSIPQYIHMLNKFDIPYVAVYDSDDPSGTNKTAAESSRKIEEEIQSGLGFSVVIDNKIETELKMPDQGGKKPYKALKYVSEEGYVIPENLKTKLQRIFE